MQDDWPFSSGYFPMGIIRSRPTLSKRRCIRQGSVRVPVDEEIKSAWEQLLKGDTRQGRPVGRCPSVPVDYLYSCSRNNRTKVLRPRPLLLTASPLVMSD